MNGKLGRIGLGGATMLAIITLGTGTARATNVDVFFGLINLPSTLTAGAPNTFSAKVQNDSAIDYSAMSLTFIVKLGGLTPSGIVISRAGTTIPTSVSGVGEVTAQLGTVALAPRRQPTATQSWAYQITFTKTAPSGSGSIQFVGYSGGALVGSGMKNITVVNPGGPPPTAQPTASVSTGANATAKPTTAPTARASAVATAVPAGPGSGTINGSTPPASGDPGSSVGNEQIGGQSAASLPGNQAARQSGISTPVLASVLAGLLAAGCAIAWLVARGRRSRRL